MEQPANEEKESMEQPTNEEESMEQPANEEKESMEQPTNEEESMEQPANEKKESMKQPAIVVPEEALVQSRPYFTSEIYKIEVQNLPKFFGIGEAKKLFNKKLGLQVHKFKYAGKKSTYMFLNFKNEEDREKGVAIIDGFEHKGKKLRAFNSKPAKDPLVRAKQKEASREVEVDTRPFKEQILSATCPLYDMPYEKQIEAKTGIVSEIIEKYHKALMKDNPSIKDMVNGGSLVLPHLETFIKSPVTEGYRNKCEFTIGLHPEDRDKVQVGFRLKSYKSGSTSVMNAEDVPFVPEEMKKVANFFEDFVSRSGYATYDPIALSGHWMVLLLRINSQKEMMIKATLDPQKLSQAELSTLQDKLKSEITLFKEEKDIRIVSLLVHFKSRSSGESSSHLLLGERFFYESLGSLRFKVSPESFFQINTPAAELLYSKAGELADLNPQTTSLIDVCCGTGTIGLFLSCKCKKVYGVDIISEAIQDAKTNAKMNNISNVDFRAGKAEHLLGRIFKDVAYENKEQSSSSRVVAIVDPPRNGLHPTAVKAIRASDVDTLVYISCDMSAAIQNFVNLGKPSSNTYGGDPFVPKRVIAVDLFPHTAKHFEVVILLQRLKQQGAVKE
eukprot:TRINITY_DN498_c0_g2_i1.p1 TRINITY_DN498_c0_g2~~TRINITY_DN498_c0_g2_i1.p1  ORF type:complete len:614 (+),score=163.48 TRINITY_DN498_c0_g2_i1:3-1844(+)